MLIANFDDIAAEFMAAVQDQVWCSAATLDTENRVRSRVLHPIWELIDGKAVAWIATGRTSPKANDLAHNPNISLTYMKDPLKPVYIDGIGEWIDVTSEKIRIWNLLGSTPPPVGYDPAPFFNTVENPFYGVLKITPRRIELADLFGERQVWQI